MISDDDFKAGLEMAKEAEKRAARPATKRAAPKTAKKAVKAKKPAAKKAVARKPVAKKAATQKPVPKPVAKAASKTAPKPAPKAKKPAAIPAPTAVLQASAGGWGAGYEAWTATGLKARDAYVETSRLAVTTALELGRRNLAFQRELLSRGLELGRDLHP